MVMPINYLEVPLLNKSDVGTDTCFTETCSGTPATAYLTSREHEVMQLVIRGLSNKLIADEIGVSAHTAKFHVKNACRKLGASTRTLAAVRYLSMFNESQSCP